MAIPEFSRTEPTAVQTLDGPFAELRVVYNFGDFIRSQSCDCDSQRYIIEGHQSGNTHRRHVEKKHLENEY